VSYIALGVPAVIAGVIVDHVGVLTTVREYAVGVMVLAALALVGLALRGEARPVPVVERARPAADLEIGEHSSLYLTNVG
jgi:hypothetical protein